MTIRATLLTFALASLLAAGCAPGGGGSDDFEDDADESSQGVTDGRVLIHFGNPGSAINSWGYDIKQEGRSKAMKPALAQEIFVDTGMNLLRVAVRAKDGHPQRGLDKIKMGAYSDDLDAIDIVRAARPITLVSCEMDVRAGGKYRLVFALADDASKQMEVFGKYIEVTPCSRLVWTNEEGEEGADGGEGGAITTVTFEEKGGQTLVVVHDLYPSKEALEAAIASGSTEGMPAQLAQLDEVIVGLAASAVRA